MGVLIEGISVVLLNKTIEKKYKGGFAKYQQDFANGTFCTDGYIVRLGFMAPPDVGRFVMNLQQQGLIFKQEGKCVDIAVVDQMQGFTVPCNWLIFQHSPEGVAICSLKGIESNRVAVPKGWKLENSSTLKFRDSENIKEQLQFLRTEQDKNVDVFLDRETGQEVYMARTYESHQGMTTTEDFFKKGVDLVNPYIILTDEKIKNPNTSQAREDIERGIQYLEIVTQMQPEHWPAYWFLGKVYQVLHNNEKAYQCFRSAYSINPSHVDVCRELMMESLQLGKAAEGVLVAQTAVKLAPNDPGLLANLGLALFLNANLADAKEAAQQSLAKSPSDPITKNLLKMIAQVQNGTRQQPRKISDLMKPG